MRLYLKQDMIDFADQLLAELKGDALIVALRQRDAATDINTRTIWNIIYEHLALMLND